MFKFKKIISMIILALFFGCQAPQPTPSSTPSRDLTINDIDFTPYTKFRYMDYMYNPTKGLALNNEVMTGPLYEKYREYIQNGLNLVLKAPFPDNSSTRSIQSTITNWWESLPQNLGEFFELAGYNFTEGLINYLNTTDGNVFINNLMAKLEESANNAVDHAIDQVEGYLFVGTLSLAVLATSSAITAFNTTTFSFSFFNVAAQMNSTLEYCKTVFAGISAITSIINVFQMAAINEKLDRIIKKLDEMIKKIDHLTEILSDQIIWERYQDVRNAMTKISTIQSQLNILGFNFTKRAEFLNNVLLLSTEFQSDFDKAFNSSIETLNWMRQNNYQIGTQNISGLSANLVLVGLGDASQNYTFSIPNAKNFMPIQNEDILNLKTLSTMRLNWLTNILDGNDLLEVRAAVAKEDLKKLVAIKFSLNNIPSVIDEWENTTIENMTLATPGSDVFVTFIDNIKGTSTRVYSLSESKQVIKNFLEYYLYNYHNENNKFKDDLVLAATYIAEWEVILKAHIKAWEDANN